MVNQPDLRHSALPYGPLGFVAAMVNILFIEFIAWVLLPWFYLAVFLVPVLLLDFGVSVLLAARRGTIREIGKGLMIGCIAGPAALIFFIPMYLLVQYVGLI